MRVPRLLLAAIAVGLCPATTFPVRGSDPAHAAPSHDPAPVAPPHEPVAAGKPDDGTPAPAHPADGSGTAPRAAAAGATTEDPAPDDLARSLLVLAQRMVDRGDGDGAETAYCEILDSAAGDELKQQALLAYAEFLRQKGRTVRAVAIYEKFLSVYPNSAMVPTVLVALGRSLRDLGAFDSALGRFYAVLNSTLSVTPETVGRYRSIAQVAKFEIAETHYQQGDYASAGRYFGRIKLLDLPPEEQARATFREAYAFYLDNKLEQAVGALRTFLERHPDHASEQEARHIICVSLRRLGRSQDALRETLGLLRKAQSSTAGNKERWAYWQRKTGNQLANDFFEQGDFAAALAVYTTLSELRTDPAWRWPALYQVGLCFERLRQGDRSAEAYRAILKEAAAATEAGTKLGVDAIEVQRTADWRLGQVDWATRVDKAVNAYASPAGPPPVAAVAH